MVNDKDFILTTFMEDFLKVAKVNIYTGEFTFIRKMKLEEKYDFVNAETINEYIAGMVKAKLLHPDDAQNYIFHTDITYLQKKIAEKKKRMVHTFRRKIGGVYIWVTFEITVPKDFSKDNPWVVFSWKEADNDTCVMEDAMRMLSNMFHKILKVNLTFDTHEEVKVYDEEKTEDKGFSPKISEWLEQFARLGNVYGADLMQYLEFTDINYLRSYFRKSKDCIRCRYRRKIGNDFRWVSMELLPSIEYTDEEQIIMLYIRDVHDDYISELHYQKELEYYCNYDILTGLWNRYYYKKICESYNRTHNKYSIGVLFADVNGLKYVNDNFGHVAGDEHIKKFSTMLTQAFRNASSCRISGDEFVVIFEHSDKEDMMKKVVDFHKKLKAQEMPMAAIGYKWGEAPDTIEELVSEAETAMYIDKQEFYEIHPEFIR